MTMLHTYQGGYRQLRAKDVTASETPLDGETAGKTFAFKDKPSTAIDIGAEYNGMEVIFTSGQSYVEGLTTADATAEQTSQFAMYVWADGGPAIKLCEGTVAVGTARIFNDTSKALYCNSVSIANQFHCYSIAEIDGVDDNGIGRLIFDVGGYSWFHIDFSTVSAPINALIRPY